MKKALLCVLVLLQLFAICSCDFGAYSSVRSSEKVAFVISGYNIPGVSHGFNVDVQLVEEDAYGRKMYRFSCLASIGSFYNDGYDEQEEKNIRAYVISQKETKEGVYYLDSVCYMIRQTWDNFTDELLEEFKTLNGWETEVDTDSMCYRPFPDSKWGGVKVDPLYVEVDNAYSQYTGKDPNGENVHIQYVCNDVNGKCLAFIREFDENASGGGNKAYALIVNPYSKKDQSYYVVELSDFYQNNDDIIELKKNAGWVIPKK